MSRLVFSVISEKDPANRGRLTGAGKAPEDLVQRAIAKKSRLDSEDDFFDLGLAEIEYLGKEIDFKGVPLRKMVSSMLR